MTYIVNIFVNLLSFLSLLLITGRSRGQVPFANLGGGARANAELPINENLGQTSPPPVSFADIMTVFRRAVREVKAGQTALEAGEARGGDTTYFNRTIVILLHLVCLLSKLIPHLEKEKVRTGNYGVLVMRDSDKDNKIGNNILCNHLGYSLLRKMNILLRQSLL